MTVPRRGRPRDPATDAAILRAALDMFIEHGVEGTSIEQVAKRAGVARLTVYRRWPTKEDLLLQAIDLGRSTVGDRERAALSGETHDASTDPLDEIIDVWTTALSQPKTATMFARLIGSSASHPNLLAAYWEASVLPRRELAKVGIERLRAAGRLPADTDPDVVLDILAGSIVYRMLVYPNTPNTKEIREYLRAVFHQIGVQPRKSRSSRTSSRG